ncbi:MAG: type II toxin-antitoxin system Phd/YefM family antitoxin [Erysipelotrichia bacterium]|nr:type II toxin-antitoxin system Phd/YefM family antitoxin [Erysipelotrichia bacterium]
MYNEPTGGWIMALLATLLAIWTYRVSKRIEIDHEKAFENIEFLGQKYWCLHQEEPHFMLRLKTLIEKIKQGSFGIVYEKKEPQVVLLPIDEFDRLKAIEEYLEDQEIAKIIEECLHTRDKNEPHPLEKFETLRAKYASKQNEHE